MTAFEFLGDSASRRCRCNVVVGWGSATDHPFWVPGVRRFWVGVAVTGPEDRQLGRPGDLLGVVKGSKRSNLEALTVGNIEVELLQLSVS